MRKNMQMYRKRDIPAEITLSSTSPIHVHSILPFENAYYRHDLQVQARQANLPHTLLKV